jgi:hypothetical protein
LCERDKARRAIYPYGRFVEELRTRAHRSQLVDNAIDPRLIKLYGRSITGKCGAVESVYGQTQLMIRDPSPMRPGVVPKGTLGEDDLAALLTENLGDAAGYLDIAAELDGR